MSNENDPDIERQESIQNLKEVALDVGTEDELKEEAVKSLGSLGPQAEKALSEIAAEEVVSDVRELALQQIQDINTD